MRALQQQQQQADDQMGLEKKNLTRESERKRKTNTNEELFLRSIVFHHFRDFISF